MIRETINKLWNKLPEPFRRKRTRWLAGGSIVVLAYSVMNNPLGAYTTAAFLGWMVMPILAVWFAYIARRALLDYVNMEELYIKAKETPIGSAIVFAGVCLVFYALLALFGSQLQIAKADTIPANAHKYLPVLIKEQQSFWPDHPMPFTLQDLSSTNPALVLHTLDAGAPKVN